MRHLSGRLGTKAAGAALVVAMIQAVAVPAFTAAPAVAAPPTYQFCNPGPDPLCVPLQIVPSSGLSDGQSVQLTSTGNVLPSTTYQIEQCQGVNGQQGTDYTASECDPTTSVTATTPATTNADGSGTLSVPFTIYLNIAVNGTVLNCFFTSCVVVVMGTPQYNPINFNQPPPPPPPNCSGVQSLNARWHYSAGGSAGSWSGTARCPSNGQLSMGPQAMEGDLKVPPGQTIGVGYDFTLPGNSSSHMVTFSNPQVVFSQVECASGATPSSSSFAVLMPTRSYTVTTSQWYPSGDQKSTLVYQGSISTPNLCGGGSLRLQNGGAFSASVSVT